MTINGEMNEAYTIPGSAEYVDVVGPCHLGIARVSEEEYRIAHIFPINLRTELLGLAGIAVDGIVSVHTRTEVSGPVEDLYNRGSFYNRKQIKQEFRDRK